MRTLAIHEVHELLMFVGSRVKKVYYELHFLLYSHTETSLLEKWLMGDGSILLRSKYLLALYFYKN